MAAVLDPESVSEMPAVAAWLRKDGPERTSVANPTVADQARFNVVAQLENIRTFPVVRNAERRGKLTLHGWFYDFVSGNVLALDRDSGAFHAFDMTGEAEVPSVSA
jgi:carbonic anhydrase